MGGNKYSRIPVEAVLCVPPNIKNKRRSMTTIIIAGSMYEYFDFLKKKGYPRDTKEFTFFSDPTNLYSLINVNILCIGNYRSSPVYTYERLDRHDRTLRGIKFVDEMGQRVY